jgi:predicted nucleic acid-binding protein
VVKALLDTNVVLDYLKGIEPAEKEFSRYENIAISIVTRIEVLVGVTQNIESEVRTLLDGMTTVQLDNDVAERAIVLRRTRRLKLADAIIWASAQVQDRLLVTRDIKDFPADDPGVRVPYAL